MFLSDYTYSPTYDCTALKEMMELKRGYFGTYMTEHEADSDQREVDEKLALVGHFAVSGAKLKSLLRDFRLQLNEFFKVVI